MAYLLYLESGPRRRTTMVHVLDLLGCVAVGPTTEQALAATPEAIEAFRRFLARHHDGSLDQEIEAEVAEHVTEGKWVGNGSSYVTFGPDLEPVTAAEIDVFLERFRWLQDELGRWAADQSDAGLDAPAPGGGRPARAVLLHVLSPVGPYLAAALGGASGFSAIVTAAERGLIPLAAALGEVADRAEEVVRATSAEERAAVRHRREGDVRTLRKALRRMLEHDWEHLAELSRRPGGPFL